MQTKYFSGQKKKSMNAHTFVLQEPVKRNPTHAWFHPALSSMLFCYNLLAISFSPFYPAGHKGRKEMHTAREERMAAELSKSVVPGSH